MKIFLRIGVYKAANREPERSVFSMVIPLPSLGAAMLTYQDICSVLLKCALKTL